MHGSPALEQRHPSFYRGLIKKSAVAEKDCEQVGKVIFSAGPLVLNMHGCGSCGQKHACVNDHA